jgi:hypothetical protein
VGFRKSKSTGNNNNSLLLKDNLVKEEQSKTAEYLLIIEDLDGRYFPLPPPLPPSSESSTPSPPSRSSISSSQILKVKKGIFERITVAQRDLVGGFKDGDVDGRVEDALGEA